MSPIRTLFLLCALALLNLPAMAQQQIAAASSDTESTIKLLQQAVSARDRVIADLERRVENLEQAAQRSPSGSTPPASPSVTVSNALASTSPSSPELDEEERTARAALDRTLISKGGLLLRPWLMELDNGFSYYNASSNNININGITIANVVVIGQILSQAVRQDVVLSSETVRLGLPRDFQFEVRVPYGLERSRTFSSNGTETSQRSVGIGDIEVAMYKQIHHQRNGWPDLLTGLRWKSTTGSGPYTIDSTVPSLGTGFPAIQASLTAVKASDPAVFFGSLSYTRNLSRNMSVTSINSDGSSSTSSARIAPGNTIGTSIGVALALNPSASLSLAYEQNFTGSTSLNGVHIPGSYMNAGILRLGTSYMYSPGRVIDFSLGIGLTRDAPDFQFSVSLPFRFSLKRGKPAQPAYRATPREGSSGA